MIYNMNGLGRVLRTYLKLTYKNIELSISNYMILDILKGNCSCYSDDDIEKIIKAFMYKYIPFCYSDYNIIALQSNELDKISNFKNTLGLLDKNTIYLQRELLLDLRNGNIEILRVVFHEISHLIQENMIEQNDISYKSYLLIMDRIIVNEMGKNYQRNNYNFIFEEVDANIMAEIQLYNYLSSNIPFVLSNKVEEIKKNILTYFEELNNSKRIYNKKNYDNEELLDDIIKSNPKYLSYYPILNFYYFEDGSKIPLSTIVLRKYNKCANAKEEEIMKKVKQMDEYIIKNRSGNKHNIEADLKSLLDIKTDDIEINDKKNKAALRLMSLKSDNYVNTIIDMYTCISNEIIDNLLPNKIRKKV